MATETEQLAQAVKHRMKIRGWDVQDLAQQTGITEAALYRSLTGMADWPLTRIYRVASALGISGVELLEEAESFTQKAAA